MAKGKKTLIKEIKLLNDEEILINGKEYIILETTENIASAITMKISSNGNRILRFEDVNKKARIDVKRNINVVKVTINDSERAKKFKNGYDQDFLADNDKKEILANASSFVNARKIVIKYTDKKSDTFDSRVGKSTFYFSEEVK